METRIDNLTSLKGFGMEQKPSMLRDRDETTNSLFIGRRSRKKIFVMALGTLAGAILVSGWLFGKDKIVALFDASDELAALKADMKAKEDAAEMEKRFIQSLIDRGLVRLPDASGLGLALTPNSSGVIEGETLDKAHKDFHEKYYPEDKGGGEKDHQVTNQKRKELL